MPGPFKIPRFKSVGNTVPKEVSGKWPASAPTWRSLLAEKRRTGRIFPSDLCCPRDCSEKVRELSTLVLDRDHGVTLYGLTEALRGLNAARRRPGQLKDRSLGGGVAASP